ncbi:hypothetical protein O7606_20770 [Micromonospora sp. WMMD882]|uniref:hypothetical protein n=1 Tax=Micromonospora sp. WMMD882 TaxID=3015151 RepID=UPI00248B7BDC|nr:hypothetical protein [Micromonospora sp. WMMD882]WBB78623.1 hypothetical protein O7606_20770 [Micromonospora sp. WMMD882]
MTRWKLPVTATLLVTVALGVGGCGPADVTTAGGGSTVDGPADGGRTVGDPAGGDPADGGGAGGQGIEVVAGMGAEGQALAALGFDPADLDVEPVAAPAPAASPTPGGGATSSEAKPPKRAGERRRKSPARVLLRRGALHGEAVVRAKDGGTRTVVVQRGEVTAIDGDSVTVKSTDGFTQTWSFGDDLRVVERRATVQPDGVKVGAKVGVAGAKDGDTVVARLLLVQRPR